MSQETTASSMLTMREAILMMLFGAVIWFLAAVLLQYIGPMGVYEGSARAIAYALVIPGTIPVVLLAMLIVPRHKLALGMAIGTGAATLLDGIALAWFPALYGGDVEYVAGAGAAILWGAGVGIILAFLLNRPRLGG